MSKYASLHGSQNPYPISDTDFENVASDGAGNLQVNLNAGKAFALATPVRIDPVGTTTQPVQIIAGPWPGVGGPASEVTGIVVDSVGNVLTVKHAFANVAASQTDSSIVAAVPAKVIRVLSVFCLSGAVATNLTFNSKPAGAGVAISPLIQNGAGSGEVLPHNPHGWFETVAGEGLTLTTGAGSSTGVLVNYVEA